MRVLWFGIGVDSTVALIGALVGHYELVAVGIAFIIVLVALDVAFSGARRRESQSFAALAKVLGRKPAAGGPDA